MNKKTKANISNNQKRKQNKCKTDEGKSKQEILKNIWPFERKNLVSNSIDKLNINKIESYIAILVRMDMQSKNVLDGKIWDSIIDLSVSMAKNKLSVIKYN